MDKDIEKVFDNNIWMYCFVKKIVRNSIRNAKVLKFSYREII